VNDLLNGLYDKRYLSSHSLTSKFSKGTAATKEAMVEAEISVIVGM